MVNRDRHEIVMDILNTAKPGKKKTELMRDASLSFLQTKQYLGILIEKGLLEKNKDSSFKTTEKGIAFIQKCGDCLLTQWHRQKRKHTTR
jgi:predicted transcriptional regulator